MAGMRVDPVVTERLGTMASAQGARTVGGRIPATPRPAATTAHIPGRVLPPNTATGTQGFEFSCSGPVPAQFFGTRLYNLTGSNLTITRIFASVNTAPTGLDLDLRVLLNGGVVVASLTISEGDFTDSSAPAFTWAPESYLNVETLFAAGEELTVQVVAR